MAREITLRFDAQCHDCGRALPAGSVARWFGKGRVSCCGNPSTSPGDYSPAAVPQDPPRASSARTTVAGAGYTLPPGFKGPGAVPTTPIGIGYLLSDDLQRGLAEGMSSEQVAKLASVQPNKRLLVRLQSGARFVVTAEHCAHVIRCIEESLVDRCRDVMGAAS